MYCKHLKTLLLSVPTSDLLALADAASRDA